MNIVFHCLVGLIIAKLFGISQVLGISIGVLFSIFPDFDHLPHVKKALRTGRFGVESRSPLHELVGIGIMLSGALVVWLVRSDLFPLALTCGLSHFIIDFLARPSRPLYPFSSKELDLKLYPKGLKEMFILDAILTVGLGLIYTLFVTI